VFHFPVGDVYQLHGCSPSRATAVREVDMRAPIAWGLVLVACLSGSAPLVGARAGAGHDVQRAATFKEAQPGQHRFVLQRKAATIAPGGMAEIDIELQSFSGKKVDAARDLPIRITVTTLETLAQARAALGSPTPERATTSLDGARLALPAKSSVVQQSGMFPRGEGDIQVRVTLHQPGLVRVFVEADGVVSGATLVAVGRPRMSPASLAEPDEPRLIFASLQPARLHSHRLKFLDVGNDVWRSQDGFSNDFMVQLETLDGVPTTLPTPLTVIMQVTKGAAHFVRPQLRIPAGEVLSESAELRSKRGGEVTLRANAASNRVASSDHPFAFATVPYAAKLQVVPSWPSAPANGLSPIYLTIKAIETPDGAPPRVMTASREGLGAARPVSLRFENGTCWFVDTKPASQDSQGAGRITDVVIPADAQMASVAVYCSRRASALKVVAEAFNAVNEPIEGSTTVSFSLPWLQLLAAVLGAMVLPAFKKQWARVLYAAPVGAIVYIFLFVGAVTTANFSLGDIAISLTKLPTENELAAFALGMVGYLAVGSRLSATTPTAAKPAAVTGP
jgi:hypothetical protein